jgi:serine/threonine protein kinase/tetratricopeptide (TPR) repeat protein
MLDQETTPQGMSAAWSMAVTPPAGGAAGQGGELVGTILADRYEIISLLGQGGMGAVYKARDNELERTVALKLIRPDLASNPEILRRFKQELILARDVTHRNVIRIFDLGQANGIKFITMEYVEGRDLRALLHEKGKVPVEEAVEIIAQICRALESAHVAGVVHRDLKPQNIMLDAKNRVYVMDFGIAHSLETPGMTQTGALMGTPEYMSPEQAKGAKIDARSDLFAVGIIFYELLTGISPYKADSAIATLLKRTLERPLSPTEVDAAIPQSISDVVMNCLAIDREQRYASAREILEDLGQEGPTAGRTMARTLAPSFPTVVPAPPPAKVPFWVQNQIWIGAAAISIFILAAAGLFLRGKLFSASSGSSGPPVEQASLAILPFRNGSGDASLDWLGPSLADMVSTDVGQSASLRTISADRLHQVLTDLRISAGTTIDPAMVGRIAEFSNADTVVSGQYAKFGEQIRIDATLTDVKRNRTTSLTINAASEKEIPGTVDGLAELIRKNLAVSSDVLKELKASSFQPSSKSVPALRDYDQGVQLLRDGKNLEAVKMFQTAIQEDPQFALAYSHLAETDSELGYDDDADKYSRQAIDLSRELPLAERYQIEGNRARIMKDTKKGIEAYENLAKTFPNNADVEYALGSLYEDDGNFEKALGHYGNVLKSDPKNLDALLATGRVESKSGDPQAGLDSLGRALSIAVQLQNPEQQAMILQATGISYKQLGRSDDALNNYKQSMDINTRIGKKRGVAANLSEIAQVQARTGNSDQALANLTKALSLQREIGVKKEVGDTLINLGQMYEDRGKHDDALQQFKEALQIERDSADERDQAYCLNDIGNVDFAKGQYQDALIYFQQALELRQKLNIPDEMAESLSNVGETMAKMGQYDKAIENHLKALDLERKSGDKRATAIDSSNLGLLFGYQGRIGAAVNSTADAVQTLRDMKDRSLWMAQALSGYGNALVQAGRSAEAQPVLKEGADLAKELKSDVTLAEIYTSQGDDAYYRGDAKAAAAFYQRAVDAARSAKSPEDTIMAQIGLAKIQLAGGDSRKAVVALRSLAGQASAVEFKYASLESSIYAAQALLHDKNYSDANREAQKALGQSDAQSLRMQVAREHYVLGMALRSSANSSEAPGHFRNAVQIWDEVRKEPGAEKILDRADLKTMYAEASQTTASKN